MLSFICIALICFFAGILSGVTGFGALIVMVPSLVFFVTMSVAIPLGVLCGVALQFTATMMYRTHINKKYLFQMLLGSLPGVWLGSSLLVYMPEMWLRAVLGALIIVYVLWNTLSKLPPPTQPPAAVWAYMAGFFSGAFGGAFGIAGPPAVIYATRTGWRPDAIRGFLGVFFFLLFSGIATSLILHGLVGPEVWKMAAWVVPLCLAGYFTGRRIASRLAPQQYIRIVFVLLFLMGVSLCWPLFRQLVFM